MLVEISLKFFRLFLLFFMGWEYMEYGKMMSWFGVFIIFFGFFFIICNYYITLFLAIIGFLIWLWGVFDTHDQVKIDSELMLMYLKKK